MARVAVVGIVLVSVLVWGADTISRGRSAGPMAVAAQEFLDSLEPVQRQKAVFGLDDEERFNFHFVPRARNGVPLKELNEQQRALAHEFLKTGLSQKGYLKATTIIDLEIVLREIEQSARRDPELYYFSIFGTPGAERPWGWRVEGHHLSLNFTVADGRMVQVTPQFMGANPAEVRSGPTRGLRALGAEEDLARALLQSLDDSQRRTVIFEHTAPDDIITGNARQVEPLAPAGIAAGALRPEQAEKLRQLVHEYLSRMPEDIAADRLETLHAAGWEKIHFAWAGGVEKGDPHYYRVQGPTFLIEYDNVQNEANHIHTVWRDFQGDFGRDLLREHYRTAPQGHGHDH
jgi:hypothetical protein